MPVKIVDDDNIEVTESKTTPYNRLKLENDIINHTRKRGFHDTEIAKITDLLTNFK